VSDARSDRPISADSPAPSGWRRILRSLLLVLRYAIIAAVVWYVVQLFRSVDWSEVGYAITHLAWWEVLVLAVAVLVRQSTTAFPLSRLVPGLGFRRALHNDLAATIVSTVAPNPSDVVLRLTMFRSWRLDTATSSAGLTLHTLLFYAARLLAPGLGFLGIWIWWTYDSVLAWSAAVSVLTAAALVIGLVYALRAEGTAHRLGVLLARLVRKVRPKSGDETAWGRRFVDFQARSSNQMRAHAGAVVGALVVLLAVEPTIVVLGLAFTGVPMDLTLVMLVVFSFWVVYPLTALPMMGLGVLEAGLVALVTDHSSLDSTELVAGLVIWRVTAQLVPNLLGLGALAWWKYGPNAPAPEPDPT